MINVYVVLKSKKLSDDICVFIKKSDSVKVLDVFYSINDCRKKLEADSLRKKAADPSPDVILLGLDTPGGNWADFCLEIQTEYPPLKILTIASYDDYNDNKDLLNALTSGYISADAWPKVINDGIKAVHAGFFFRHDKIDADEPKAKEMPDTGKLKLLIREEFLKQEDVAASQKEEDEPTPEWLNPIISFILSEIMKNLSADGGHQEMVDNMTKVINASEKTRKMLIEIYLSEANDLLADKCREDYATLLIENMLLKGYSNWEIADMLNIDPAIFTVDDDEPNLLDIVRSCRLDLILKLSGKNTMSYRQPTESKPHRQPRKSAYETPLVLKPREAQLLRLIAAGYSNEEISDYLDRSIETIKTNRRNLIEKFGTRAKENTMSMVIKALRMGLIRLEEIDDL